MVSPLKNGCGDLHCSGGGVGLEIAARTSGMYFGQYLRGTSGWMSEFLCSEMPLELWRMKDNLLQGCLVSTTAEKKI